MNTNRDSFDHRFGDDLLELILGYLPIRDKMRYESVSKRFQRFVFNKQRVLKIGNFEDNDNTFKRVKVWKLRKLLKKFPFITTIIISVDLGDQTYVVNTIANHSNHLNSLHIPLKGIKSATLKKFCQKFGQKIKYISLDNCDEEVATKLLEVFTNLRRVSHLSFKDMNNSLLSMNLCKIDNLVVNQNQFQLLSTQCLPNLRHLDICVRIESKPNIVCFNAFKQMKNLMTLKIKTINRDFGSDFWTKTIESIAKNSHLLYYFSFECRFRNRFNAKKCFESFVHFSELKMVWIFIANEDKNQEILEEQMITDLKPLKNCKDLYVLCLILPVIDQTFNNIDTYLPKLRAFILYCLKHKISDKLMESMAKLKYLKLLAIIYQKVDLTIDDIESLIQNCKRLKALFISPLPGNTPTNNDQQMRANFERLRAHHKNIDLKFGFFK